MDNIKRIELAQIWLREFSLGKSSEQMLLNASDLIVSLLMDLTEKPTTT